MYSKEELEEKSIQEWLFNAAPDDQDKFKDRLDELLENQYEGNKYEVITSIKVDENTSAATIKRFGELCETMSDVSFNVTYGNSNLEARRPRKMEDRIAEVVASERWRRTQQNKREKEAMEDLA
jgi:hypothetical protein